jgi:thiol-disulfide isomerase/thioredoxin
MRNGSKMTILLAAIVLLFFRSATTAQSEPLTAIAKPQASPTVVDPEKAKADLAWKNVGKPTDPSQPIAGVKSYFDAVKKWGSNSPEFLSWFNRSRLRFREEGLKFWREFPNDKRRYVWLYGTVHNAPFYWKDWEKTIRLTYDERCASTDEKAQRDWDEAYIVMRAEHLASPQVTDAQRGYLLAPELFNDIGDTRCLALARGLQPDYRPLINRLLDLARNPFVVDARLKESANVLLKYLGVGTTGERAFLDALKLSSRTELQLFAAGRDQVTKLRSNPFELQTVSMTGEKIDVAKLRGKIVLIEIWSNWCSACIAAMPKVQAVYEKYRDKGFEIVGVWTTYDEATEKPIARKILAEKGVTYPNAVLASEAALEFQKRYSIIGVPVTFLLDKEGKLVTNDISGAKLEQEVSRLLQSGGSK